MSDMQQAGAPYNYPPPNYPPPNYPPPAAFAPPDMRAQHAGAPQYGAYGPVGAAYPAIAGRPSAHWPLAIIAVVMSGLLGGAVAVYFAYQVGQRWQAGNPAGAADASRLAKIWGIVGIVVGALVFLLMLASAGSTPSYG
jgi:hypothetical protein